MVRSNKASLALSIAALAGIIAFFSIPPKTNNANINPDSASPLPMYHIPQLQQQSPASHHHRRLSVSLPDGGCEISWPEKPPPGIAITYAASYPGCGARMTWNLVEALTGLWTGDDWNNNGRGEDVVTVKTHYPQSNGIVVPFDEKILRGFVVVRNPMKSIPSFFNHIYETRNHLAVHSVRAPVEEWIKWRDAYIETEIAEYKKFLFYWMDRFSAENRLVVTYEGLTDNLIGPEVTKVLNEFLGQVEGVNPIDRSSVACVWRAVVKNEPPPAQKLRFEKLQSQALNQPQGTTVIQPEELQQQGAMQPGDEQEQGALQPGQDEQQLQGQAEQPPSRSNTDILEQTLQSIQQRPLGPDGQPQLDQQVGPDGQPQLDQQVGPDGQPQLDQQVGPDGQPLDQQAGPDGQPQLDQQLLSPEHQLQLGQAQQQLELLQQHQAQGEEVYQQGTQQDQGQVQNIEEAPVDPAQEQLLQSQFQPPQQPGMQSLQQPLQQPGMPSQYQPPQQPGMPSQYQPPQQPGMQSLQQPLQQPGMQSLQQPLQQPGMQSLQQPLQQPGMQSLQQPLQQPGMQSLQQPLQQPGMQSLQQPPQQPGLRRRLDPGHHDSQRSGPEQPRPYTAEQLDSMMNMLLEVATKYEKEDVRLYHIMVGYYEHIRGERAQLSSEPMALNPPGGFY